jgi:hypothetical protein
MLESFEFKLQFFSRLLVEHKIQGLVLHWEVREELVIAFKIANTPSVVVRKPMKRIFVIILSKIWVKQVNRGYFRRLMF